MVSTSSISVNLILYKVKCVNLNLKNPWKSENFENISYTVNLYTKDTKLRNIYFYKEKIIQFVLKFNKSD